jgi:carbonic anhydrase/acetyltransferase-like protein (isoleucine patch superfamily)
MSLSTQVTIGHGALLTSCTVGDRSLIGQGAVVQEGCEIGSNSIVAAGAVVLPGATRWLLLCVWFPVLLCVFGMCEHFLHTVIVVQCEASVAILPVVMWWRALCPLGLLLCYISPVYYLCCNIVVA